MTHEPLVTTAQLPQERSDADALDRTDDPLTDELRRIREALDRGHQPAFRVFDKYIGAAAGLYFAWSAGQGKDEFCVVVSYLPEGDGVAGNLNPRMRKDHIADFLGAGGHPSVLVDVRQVLDEQEWVVEPLRGLVRLYRINDLQRVVADAPLHEQRLGRSKLVTSLPLKNRKQGLGCHRVVALFADEDSGKVVERTPEVHGRIPDGERYGLINRLEDDPGPVHSVSIKVEFNFAADRWWAAVEIGPDAAVEIGYVLVGPFELGVDIAELLAQWVTSS